MESREALLDGAAQASAAAALRSGVRIHEATDLDSQASARGIFDRVWPADDTQVTPNLLRAIVHAGGYCSLAVDPAGMTVVGAAMAIVGRDGEGRPTLHSHMAGVLDGHRDRHIGTALKLHQRLWALRQGIPVVSWTFDPLVRRNAYVNLVKLGVRIGEYHVDFYGEMLDSINAGDPSDRLVAVWEVASDRAAAAAAGGGMPVPAAALDARALLAVGAAGEPLRVDDIDADAVAATVAMPDDIVALRERSPEAAARWRLAMREALLDATAAGLHVESITDDGRYLLRREGSPR